MKVLSSQFLLSTVCAAALLTGCGSSSSDPTDEELQFDPTGTGGDTGIETGGDTGTETGTETGTATGGDTGTETGTATGGDTGTETGTETGGDTGTETGTATGGDTGTDTGTATGGDTGTDTGTATGGDTGTETGTATGGDTGTETDASGNPPESGVDILVPSVTAGSDLDRLIKGIKRQVSLTLLDLNQRLSEGVELTDQQETCLGAFDPTVGEQLLSIDCERALATDNISVYVGEAAFYETAACQASMFDGNSENCQLQRAGLELPDLWRLLEGERRPEPIFTGINVSYALTDTLLHIENIETALEGPFKCEIDLTSGSSSSPLVGISCASIITSSADYLDDVVPQ